MEVKINALGLAISGLALAIALRISYICGEEEGAKNATMAWIEGLCELGILDAKDFTK